MVRRVGATPTSLYRISRNRGRGEPFYLARNGIGAAVPRMHVALTKAIGDPINIGWLVSNTGDDDARVYLAWQNIDGGTIAGSVNTGADVNHGQIDHNVTLTFNVPAAYVPGQTYTMRITASWTLKGAPSFPRTDFATHDFLLTIAGGTPTGPVLVVNNAAGQPTLV
jgi:hypothetical protein